MGRFCRPRFFSARQEAAARGGSGALVSVFRRGGVLSVRRSEIEFEDDYDFRNEGEKRDDWDTKTTNDARKVEADKAQLDVDPG